MGNDWILERASELGRRVRELVDSESFWMDDSLPVELAKRLRDMEAGVYAIRVYDAPPGEYLAAGMSGNLLRRIRSHARESGKLAKLLVREGIAYWGEVTEDWIPSQCKVQFLRVARPAQLERMMLALLNPKYEFGINWRWEAQDP